MLCACSSCNKEKKMPSQQSASQLPPIGRPTTPTTSISPARSASPVSPEVCEEIARQGLIIEKPMCTFSLGRKITVCVVNSTTKTTDNLYTIRTLPLVNKTQQQETASQSQLSSPVGNKVEKSTTFDNVASLLQNQTRSSDIFDLQIRQARELRRLSEKHRKLGQSYVRYAQFDRKSAGQLFFDAYNKTAWDSLANKQRSGGEEVLFLKELFLEEAKHFVRKKVAELRRQLIKQNDEINSKTKIEKMLILIVDDYDSKCRPESRIRWPLIDFVRAELGCSCLPDSDDPRHRLIVKVSPHHDSQHYQDQNNRKL